MKVTTKIGIFFLTLAFGLGFPVVAGLWHEMKCRGNEQWAVISMRDIRSAQTRFKRDRGRYGTLQELAVPKEFSPKDRRASSGGFGLYLDDIDVIRASSTNAKNPSVTDGPLSEQ